VIHKKAAIAWAFYDWATGAFPTLVITFIFATYFTQAVTKNAVHGMAQWGDAIAIAGVMVALLSPISGAIADHQGRRKPWLLFCVIMLIISTGLLWFIKPAEPYATAMLAIVVLGTVSYEVGYVFYNAMLQDLASPQYLGRVSGWSWGFGYMGGLLCLVLALVLFVKPPTPVFHFNTAAAEQIRICGPYIALWILLFSWPIFVFTPDRPKVDISIPRSISLAFGTLYKTLRMIPTHRNIFMFLIARMIYTDGLNALFAFGGIYAAGTFGLSFSQVMEFGIGMSVMAAIGATTFAWFDDRVGAKKVILLSLFFLMTIGVCILVIHSTKWFVILAFTLGLFIGSVQSASRSFMARIAPKEMVTELFGLYALSGKATAFMNPWIIGTLTAAFNSQRIGMSTIFLFLFVGSVMMLWVS
jgi:UMF1 family MFS transporter